MMEELISIIVPVYQVREYLPQCIESILKQTYQWFEVILVDDGSNDGSAEICDCYKEKDSRIKVIHKENGGLSSARNAGLEIAKGKYITFVDSDDFIDLNYCELLIECMVKENADVAMCDFLRFENSNQFPNVNLAKKYEVLSGKAVCEHLYDKDGAKFTIACCKMYKAEFWETLRFPIGKLHEDEYTTYKILYACQTVVMLSTPLYFYRCNNQGIMRSSFSVKRYDALYAFEERLQFFNEKHEDIFYYKTKKQRDIMIAKYSIRARKSKIYKLVPKEYKMGIIQAIKLLKRETQDEEFEYFLYQYYPKWVLMYSFIKKILYKKNGN